MHYMLGVQNDESVPLPTGADWDASHWIFIRGYLPKQPGYHKRLIAAAPLIMHATRLLAAQVPSHVDQLRLIDATRCPAAPPARRSNACSWRVGRTTATAPPTPASTGG